METASALLIAVAFGLISMVMAENRGRDKYLGLASGLLFGIFTIVYYWIAGDTPEEKEKKAKELLKNKKETK